MRILVVDDDPSVAEVIAGAVRAAGHEALVALDGTEALDVLQATPVDGVFLDLVMPGLGGLPVLRRIRAQYPRLPVVIVSAYAEEAHVDEALALGAEEVVLKPAALAQLSLILDRLAHR